MLVYQRDPGPPKAAGGGHREGDPVAAGDGDDSTSKFGMIYY